MNHLPPIDSLERSKSVQSRVPFGKRGGGGRGDTADSSEPGRPISMNDARMNRAGGGGVRGGGAVERVESFKQKAIASVKRPRMPVVAANGSERKHVAFGGRSNALPPPGAGLPEKVADPYAKIKPTAKRTIAKYQELPSEPSVHSTNNNNNGGGGGAFSKLLQNANKKGTVVVTHEDGSDSPVKKHGFTNPNNENRVRNKRSVNNTELKGIVCCVCGM